ncbi:MAG: hypothetical protein ABH952_04435 [Candidatus Omnitrophota bacterium]
MQHRKFFNHLKTVGFQTLNGPYLHHKALADLQLCEGRQPRHKALAGLQFAMRILKLNLKITNFLLPV